MPDPNTRTRQDAIKRESEVMIDRNETFWNNDLAARRKDHAAAAGVLAP